jgi:hypothetical protein
MVIRSQTRIALTILFAVFFFWIVYPGQYYFLNDDFFHIPLAAQKNFVHGGLLRPVSDISLWLDHLIWGKEAFGYHLTNMLIHLINVLLVYRLAKDLFFRFGAGNRAGAGTGVRAWIPSGEGSRAELKAWLAALLFLVYAFHSEPILWIIGRGGSLTTLFFLGACVCYLKRGDSSWYFFFSLVFFCIGLFVYESIWIFPLVAGLLSVADVRVKGARGRDGEEERSEKKDWGREGMYLILIAGLFGLYLLFRYSQTGELAGSYATRMLPDGNLSRLLYNYNGLLARSFLPPMANGKLFLVSYGVLLILLGLAVLHILKKKMTGVMFWLTGACLLISLLPAITLGIDTHNTESERFIYLPSVWCVLFLVEMIFLLVDRPVVAVRLLLLFIILHAIQFRHASLSYRYAGKIARRSLELIGADPPVRNLYLFHMPSQYEGALIFRAGIGPAVAWMDMGSAGSRLAELSQGELFQRRDSLVYMEGELRGSAASLGATIRADSVVG